MKLETSNSFTALSCIIVILVALGCSFVINARAPAADESPAELSRQVGELYREGKFEEAIPVAEKLVTRTKQARGEENAETAASINLLARLYESVGKYARAEPLYKEALEICQKVLGREHPNTATSLNNLGLLYKVMGDYAKSEPLLKEALEIRQKVLGHEHPDTVRSLNNLATLYQDMGDYAKAEPLYKETLAICQKVLGREHPDTAKSLNNLATLYQDMGDYAKAESLFKEALEIRKKVLGAKDPDTATSLNNLAEIYWVMGDYAKVEQLYKEALEIYQSALGRENRLTALGLNNLATLYSAIGDYAKAEPLLKEALEIYQKALGREHPNTASSLNNLALLYKKMGDYAKAESLYKEALEIRQKVLGPEHPNTARSLNNLATLYQGMGDYAKAEPLYKEALEICQKALGPEHPYTATSLNNLAYLEFDLGQSKEASALARSAADAQHNLLSIMFSFCSEQQRLSYLATLNPYSLFALLPGCQSDMALALLRYKGVVLDSVIEDRLLAQASTNAEDQNQVERLESDRKQLDRLLLQASKKLSETSQQVEELEQEVERLEGQLARRVAGLGQARRALGVTLQQVQTCLPADGALIEYVRYGRYLGKYRFERAYGALVLLAQGAPQWIPLGSAEEVDRLVRRYSRLASSNGDDGELATNLRALFDALWAPLEAHLPGGTQRLIVSPDGQLNFVSLATLLTPQGQFLGEKFKFQYISSGREFLQERPPKATRDVVLFADPEFGTSRAVRSGEQSPSQPMTRWSGSEKRSFQGLQFASLPGTRAESERLLQLFEVWRWPSLSHTGQKATKAALMKVHSPFILHLATHGFFEPQDPSEKAPESDGDNPVVSRSKFFANPMHQSGLALSGANETLSLWDQGQEVAWIDNDGILTAEDVTTIDLHGTWLVTLSACDTAKGEARAGEGVMGLRRGFIQAGAQNLLMTLWPVSDEVTVQIMSDFYQAAHQSGNAPEALAEVQRDWLVKLRKERGLAEAVSLAGQFIMSAQGKP